MAAAYKGLKTTWLHFLLSIKREQAQITQQIGCEPGELIQEPGLGTRNWIPRLERHRWAGFVPSSGRLGCPSQPHFVEAQAGGRMEDYAKCLFANPWIFDIAM